MTTTAAAVPDTLVEGEGAVLASPTVFAPVFERPEFIKMREVVHSPGDTNNWDEAWKAGVIPWDNGMCVPALREVVEGEVEFPKKGKVLVPGCGSGYDVIYLASALDSSALGLDASETANEAAKKNLAASEHADRDIKFEMKDFFTYTVADEERFDVAYDYTFFVAIPPALRVDWGKQMNALIKPGGFLIAVVYPIDPYTPHGPPFYVRPEHLEEALGEKFIKVFDKIPTTSIPRHVGRERTVVWRKLN